MWRVQWPNDWPSAPSPMSYSTMRAIETCPLQRSLAHASYPEIWDRKGYPNRAYIGTVVGQVVHQALERITKALERKSTILGKRAPSASSKPWVGTQPSWSMKATSPRPESAGTRVSRPVGGT